MYGQISVRHRRIQFSRQSSAFDFIIMYYYYSIIALVQFGIGPYIRFVLFIVCMSIVRLPDCFDAASVNSFHFYIYLLLCRLFCSFLCAVSVHIDRVIITEEQFSRKQKQRNP